ncbi:MAG: xanthine dehydrogenase family protein molybdopterin-binding subunit, partial [Gemmatimonadales bacterium]
VRNEDVTTHVTLMGGGFGRRINPDFTVEAALVAQRASGGAPVQVVWTRADDLGHGFYRPCAIHRVDAVLGPDGMPLAWRHRFITPSINSYGQDASKPPRGGWGADESDGSANMLYRIPNRAVEYTLLESGVPRGWWRAVHTTHNTYVVETMIDELAERAGKDPLEYRLALIDQLPADVPGRAREFPQDPARLKGVLRLAAEKAGWPGTRGQGRAMGMACGWDHNSYAAVVVEVSTDGRTDRRTDGQIRVERVVVAADCGPVLNPTGARAQLEGGVIQALSSVLKEKITIRGGAVEQGNFDTYPILRISEAPPRIETYFVETDTSPTGLGEPAVPPTGPALANAIYRATGKRVRSLPAG